MKKALILAAALSFSASTAFAGGPVIIEDVIIDDVPAEKSVIGAWLPLVVGLVVVGAALAGSGS